MPAHQVEFFPAVYGAITASGVTQSAMLPDTVGHAAAWMECGAVAEVHRFDPRAKAVSR